MSWWGRVWDDDEVVEPFTILLSVGAPGVTIGTPNSEERQDFSDSDDERRRWAWQDTITSVLHAVFARGGSVVAGFDEDTFPLLWSTALSYAEAVPGEHGDRRTEVPLQIIATEQWYEAADLRVDAFEATGAVRIWRERPTDDVRTWPPGPGSRLGVVLLAGDRTLADLSFLNTADRILEVDWADAPTWDRITTRTTDRIRLEDEYEPFDAHIESRIDDWLGGLSGEPQ